MKKFAVSCLLIGIVSCSVSPKKLDELNSENNYYSPAQTIKCMQMQTPQRPHPINKKGEVRESYDQGDCYDDLLTKNTRELDHLLQITGAYCEQTNFEVTNIWSTFVRLLRDE